MYKKLLVLILPLFILISVATCLSVSSYIKNRSDPLLSTSVTDDLAAMLVQIPTSARVSIGVIHAPILMNQKQSPRYTFSVITAVTKKGFRVLPNTVNAPLSQWTDIIDSIIQDKCLLTELAKLTDPESVLRMKSYGISAAMVCPMITNNNKVLGVVMLSWDLKQPISPNEDQARDFKILKTYTDKLTSDLNQNQL
jgi:hypothetical protein